jgi:hypothetical protein
MFKVLDYNAKTNNFTFGRGGFQGARGGNDKNEPTSGGGGDFFIENVYEELDYSGEFFHNRCVLISSPPLPSPPLPSFPSLPLTSPPSTTGLLESFSSSTIKLVIAALAMAALAMAVMNQASHTPSQSIRLR